MRSPQRIAAKIGGGEPSVNLAYENALAAGRGERASNGMTFS
jgi:hypothetical protein